MEAFAVPSALAAPRSPKPLIASVAWYAAMTGFAVLALAGALVALRRLAGAFDGSLSALAISLLALLLAFAAAVFRAIGRAAWIERRSTVDGALRAVPSLVLVLWGVGVLLPGTSVLAVAVFVGVVLAEEGWSWGRAFPRRARRREMRQSAAAIPPTTIEAPGTIPAEAGEEAIAARSLSADPNDHCVTQWMARHHDDETGEMIEGWCRVAFQAGQRHATAHVAVCPPLAGALQAYAEPADGLPARIKVAQVLPHGVRLEIKLDEPAADDGEVLVEFSILQQVSESL